MRRRATTVAMVLVAGHSWSAVAIEDAAPLPDPLRLERVLERAHGSRAEVAAARARARAAAQRPAIVSSLPDPVVYHSIDHLPIMQLGISASLSVEQQFPLSRVRGHRRHAAEADARRARADVDRVELDVELDAASAFLMLQERRQTAVILEEQLALARHFVRAATARFSTGVGGQADVLRAEIDVARLEGTLRAIAAEIRAAEAMLNTSLNRAAAAPVPRLDSTVATEDPPPLGAASDAARAQRPELAAGRAEIDRAEAEIAVMRSMYAPMMMVRTGPAYTMIDGPGWMLMVGVTLPVQRGRLRAGVAEAQAMAQMSRADLEAMQRMVDGDVAASREQVNASRERLLALRDQVVPRARRVIDPALAEYAAGKLPLVSVIEAAQALRSSQAELVGAELNLGLAWTRLHRSIGNKGQKP